MPAHINTFALVRAHTVIGFQRTDVHAIYRRYVISVFN